MGWKWGCQPFSTADRRFVGHVCLRHRFPPFLLGLPSIHSLPEAGSSERQYIHQFCMMVPSCPSLRCSFRKSTCVMQRSKAFGHAIVVSKTCYNTVIVLSLVLWDCCKPTNTCGDWAFSNSGLAVGLPAFQLPMFAKCDALPKGDILDMFVQDIHSCCSFLEFQAPTQYQKLNVAESGSTLHQLCSMLESCPSFCKSCRKNQSHAEKQRVWSRSCRVQDLLRTIQWLCPRLGLQDIDCALTCAVWLLQTNQDLSRLSF